MVSMRPIHIDSLGSHLGSLLSSVYLAVLGFGYPVIFHSDVHDHRFLSSVFLPPKLQDISTGSISGRLRGLQFRSTRAALVGSSSSHASSALGYRKGHAFPAMQKFSLESRLLVHDRLRLAHLLEGNPGLAEVSGAKVHQQTRLDSSDLIGRRLLSAR